MRKKILFLLLVLFIFIPRINAKNIIYNMDIVADLQEDGSAKITESWHVSGSNGTEWYKVMNNLGNMSLTNFKVSMDGKELTYKNWNVDESLNEKKGYYGINYTNEGLELCFGKYDYKEHTFILSYELSNFIFNTDDSQLIYYNFIDTLSNVDFRDYTVTVKGFYNFPDTLDVWGYGYKGYAYVKDGVISMSNEGNMGSNYAVLLAKFPLDTFKTNNRVSGYDSFDEILNMANEGTFKYDYDEGTFKYDYDGKDDKTSLIGRIFDYIFELLPILILTGGTTATVKNFINSGYGYKDNKKIDKKNTPMFRDIPCNKDIYYADVLIKLNEFNYNENNILGAVILKWVRQDKIVFINEKTGIFNKETTKIDLTLKPTFDNQFEQKLFDILYVASEDGILETKELEKWCRKNYTKFFNLFKENEDSIINKLKTDGLIYKRENKKECKKKNIMSDTLYDESKKLYGLKLFLEEFSKIDTKEVIEVKLWDEYLMFAYLFGIADKVAKQLKNLYPETMSESKYDYDTVVFINNISSRSVSAARSARSAAESYSGGGGGFSSGGGGGGSFGGGGGGSR